MEYVFTVEQAGFVVRGRDDAAVGRDLARDPAQRVRLRDKSKVFGFEVGGEVGVRPVGDLLVFTKKSPGRGQGFALEIVIGCFDQTAGVVLRIDR
jgi:hypothetical protein